MKKFKYEEWFLSRADNFRDEFIINQTGLAIKSILEYSNSKDAVNRFVKKSIKKYVENSNSKKELETRIDKILDMLVEHASTDNVYNDDWNVHMFKLYNGQINSSELYPTINETLKMLGDSCMGMMYSVIKTNGCIPTHIDAENITGQYVNVHLPLFLEDNTCYMIIDGIRSDLKKDQLFFLDSSKRHSAHNTSLTIDRVTLFSILKIDSVFDD